MISLLKNCARPCVSLTTFGMGPVSKAKKTDGSSSGKALPSDS
ncbi:MAG: hypothetical protein Hyperionvirus6_109 [Hyperionvirus sp.]|uniref:Uncharacterized protein n=1 Tax=Hyperionvirus sp. TaxID=2487770 RepID=A0A3G5A8A3_9VIRU|nr:MAG: hypothetical protein Hyperionvirus6_109 [Hyperionvirus sp.]